MKKNINLEDPNWTPIVLSNGELFSSIDVAKTLKLFGGLTEMEQRIFLRHIMELTDLPFWRVVSDIKTQRKL